MNPIPIDEMIDGTVRCVGCGADLSESGAFRITGALEATPTYSEESIQCTSCGMAHALRYDWFDDGGHVAEHVFTEDPNDPFVNWFDPLTPGQRKKIQEHIERCATCQGREMSALLENAQFAAVLHGGQGQMRSRRGPR